MKRLLLAGALSGCLVAAQAKEPVPVGDEFQVSSFTSGYQARPSVAVDSVGNFVVVWDSPGSYGTDDSGSSIQGQLYTTRILFSDGFESGDTSAWSATQP